MSLIEPPYQRPFEQADFRGYFTWTARLTKDLGGSLYHACHEDELSEALDDDLLQLRSEWKIKLPMHGLWKAPGIWTGLNYFHNGNYYGPFLIELPLAHLNNRRFMAFRRTGGGRYRVFFVQYEARIPIYSFGKKTWREVRPEAYFDKNGKDGITLKPRAIYDILLTDPLPLAHASISGTTHVRCISGKCKGMSRQETSAIITRIARRRFKAFLRDSDQYRQFIRRYPDLEGQEITLPEV